MEGRKKTIPWERSGEIQWMPSYHSLAPSLPPSLSRLQGLLAVSDKPRPEATRTVAALQRMGIEVGGRQGREGAEKGKKEGRKQGRRVALLM